MKKFVLAFSFLIFIFSSAFSNNSNLSSSVVRVPYSTASGINILFKNRLIYEMEYKMQGVVDFSAYVLNNEYKKMKNEFDEIGCELQFTDYAFIPFDDYYTRDDMSFIRIKSPNENVEKALVLVKKLIEKAKKISKDDFEKAKMSTKRSNMMRRSSTKTSALNALKKELFKGDYPNLGYYSFNPNYDYLEFKNFVRNYFSNSNIIVSVVGDFDMANVNNVLKKTFFPYEKNVKKLDYRKAILQKTNKKEVVLENKKQGFILYTIPLNNLTVNEIGNLMVVTSYISEKLTFQLREKEGLAYSMGAYLTNIGGNLFFVVSMATSPDKVDYSKGEIVKIIKKTIENGINEEELLKTKNKLAGQRLMKRLTNINKAFFMSINLNLGRPLEYEKKVDKAITDTTLENFKKATKFIDFNKSFTVLVK